MAFLVLSQGAIAKSLQNAPEELSIDCHHTGCDDRTFHTYERFEGCILDRGDTVDVARRLWFGKKQFNNLRTLSVEQAIHPVPLRRFPAPAGPIEPAVAHEKKGPPHSDPPGLTYHHIESARTNVGSAPPASRHPCGQSRCHAGSSHRDAEPIEEKLSQKLAKSTDLVKDLKILVNRKRRSFRKEDDDLIERAIETFRKLDAVPPLPALEDMSDTTEIDETTDRMNLHSGNIYLDAARLGYNLRAAILYGWAGPGDGDETENCGMGVLVGCEDDGKVKWVCHDCDNTGCPKCMHIPLENRARKQTLKDLCYMVLQRARLVRRYDIMLQHVTASPPKWLRDAMEKDKDPKVHTPVPVSEQGAAPALVASLPLCRIHVH